MDLTVDKLEQMFQNMEVTLDCMLRRMRWETQQQDKDGSFPLDPLLPVEELEYFQKRLATLVAQAREIRTQKRRTMAAIEEKVNRSMELAGNVQSRVAAPGVTALLAAYVPAAEEDTEDAPAPVLPVPPPRPEARIAPVQSQAPAPAPPRNAHAARGGARGRRAHSPPHRATGGGVRMRRPPL